MAAGRPVIAYAGGGALETVIPGVTGEFFRSQTPESLTEALRGFDDALYDPLVLRSHAEKYSRAVFKKRLGEFIDSRLEEHRRGASGS
jgi:glycosyltransferase involved in cell wall biosynthesis